jgi:hypothetical protein
MDMDRFNFKNLNKVEDKPVKIKEIFSSGKLRGLWGH